MDIKNIYHPDIPGFISELCTCTSLRRLEHVGMNCGCEYTSYPRFRGMEPYSRFEHSLGAALIVWHFTGDRIQSISALLHDIATPAFAHVIDFMHGDHVKQESTEDRTLQLICSDRGLVRTLEAMGIKPSDVADYHIFPIADNDTPRLSSDRLEYTFGNMINYGFSDRSEARGIYEALKVGKNEDGVDELMFSDRSIASAFARRSISCSRIYSGDEDRYSMQMLSELIADCIKREILSEEDLYTTEASVIEKMCSDSKAQKAWEHYRSLHSVRQDGMGANPRIVEAKKRHIDPMVCGEGRVSSYDKEYRKMMEEYLDSSFGYVISEDIRK